VKFESWTAQGYRHNPLDDLWHQSVLPLLLPSVVWLASLPPAKQFKLWMPLFFFLSILRLRRRVRAQTTLSPRIPAPKYLVRSGLFDRMDYRRSSIFLSSHGREYVVVLRVDISCVFSAWTHHQPALFSIRARGLPPTFASPFLSCSPTPSQKNDRQLRFLSDLDRFSQPLWGCLLFLPNMQVELLALSHLAFHPPPPCTGTSALCQPFGTTARGVDSQHPKWLGSSDPMLRIPPRLCRFEVTRPYAIFRVSSKMTSVRPCIIICLPS